jgi:hypothetical protein
MGLEETEARNDCAGEGQQQSNQPANNTLTFSDTTDLDCSSVAHFWCCSIPKISEISPIGKTGFDKVGILILGPQCAYRYIPDDAAYSGLLRDMVFINYRNLIKIVLAVFEKLPFCVCGRI